MVGPDNTLYNNIGIFDMSKRSKACDITPKVRAEVIARDNGRCCLCGRPGNDIAHYISRAHMGLGIPHNLLVLCRGCHHSYDNSKHRQTVKLEIKTYLKGIYTDWNEDKLKYRKWG